MTAAAPGGSAMVNGSRESIPGHAQAAVRLLSSMKILDFNKYATGLSLKEKFGEWETGEDVASSQKRHAAQLASSARDNDNIT